MNTKIIKSITLSIFISFLSLNTFAQKNLNKESFKTNFEDSIDSLHHEKVFIHTDRNDYITGETIWLSAYCVNAVNHRPSKLSKVLNIEIIDSQGVPVEQIRIKLIDGFGKGQIFLSPEIVTGEYSLISYTNWMRNYDSSLAYREKLTLVNPSSTFKQFPFDSTIVKIDLFPEGGNLVYNLKSRVAVKITDQFNTGLSVTGIVFDEYGNEITKFLTSNDGYSSFTFTPNRNTRYYTVVNYNNCTHKTSLPNIQPEGIVISVNSKYSDKFELMVKSSFNRLDSYYLIVHTRGMIKIINEFGLSDSLTLSLDKNMIDDGVSHMTIMDSQFRPLVERLIFKKPTNKITTKTTLNKTKYNQRESIRLLIDTHNLQDNEKIGNLSVSVSLANQHDQNWKSGINSYLHLVSDLPQLLDHSININSSELDLDYLMLTNGWSRFNWKDILIEDKPRKIEYIPEIYSPILSGELLKNPEESLPSSIQVNFGGKSSIMNSIDLDSSNKFALEVPFRIQTQNVFFSLDSELNDHRIKVNSQFGFKKSNFTFSPMPLGMFSKKYFDELSKNIQLSQVYKEFSHINGFEPMSNEKMVNFYGVPDLTYHLDDYTRFETTKDLFIEFIRTVVIRKRQDESELYLFENGYPKSEPLLALINGIPVDNFEYLLGYNPLQIEKIDVVKDDYYIGSRRYMGIMNFIKYEQGFKEDEIPQNIITKVYHGLQVPREFNNLDYNKEYSSLKRIPDYRNTLYWNSSVPIQDNEIGSIELFSSDVSGTYHVTVNGLTSLGNVIQINETIIIK